MTETEKVRLWELRTGRPVAVRNNFCVAEKHTFIIEKYFEFDHRSGISLGRFLYAVNQLL